MKHIENDKEFAVSRRLGTVIEDGKAHFGQDLFDYVSRLRIQRRRQEARYGTKRSIYDCGI